jgi:hypothetical protein
VKGHDLTPSRKGTTSIVPKKRQNALGLYRLRKNSLGKEFCNRARVYSCRKASKMIVGFSPCQSILCRIRFPFELFPQPVYTTVVDRRSAAASHVYGSGSKEHRIDVVFAIETSAAGVQRRANRARVDE